MEEIFSLLGNISYIASDDFDEETEMFEQLNVSEQNQFADPFKELWKQGLR